MKVFLSVALSVFDSVESLFKLRCSWGRGWQYYKFKKKKKNFKTKTKNKNQKGTLKSLRIRTCRVQ